MENPKIKKPNKYAVLVTYLVAVICLLLGLFLPLWGDKGILALQLPDIFGKIANIDVKAKWAFTLSYPINIFGTGLTVDIMAYVALLYTVVTALSLLALIPVGICVKKDSAKASIFAYIIETAAAMVTAVYVIIALHIKCCTSFLFGYGSDIGVFSYSMVIALGGSLLMLIVLSIMSKKGSGVIKTALFLLSAVALIALYDLTQLIFGNSSGKLLLALFTDGTSNVSGIDCLKALFEGSFAETLNFASTAGAKAALVIGTVAALLVILNFFIDIIALSTTAKKAGRAFNIIRYCLALVALIALLITVAVNKSTLGIMLIALPVVVLMQLLISIIRILAAKKRVKKAEEPVQEQADEEEFADEEPVVEEPVQEQPYETVETVYEEPVREQHEEPVREQVEEPVRQNDNYGFNEPLVNEPYTSSAFNNTQRNQTVQPPIKSQASQPVRANVYEGPQSTQYYTINTIYGGPVDEFMRKLSNEERIEFAMTFIEKRKGNLGNIPDYVIGGNNRLFFSSVFIYLGRIRGLISDGLLNKMYKELNIF